MTWDINNGERQDLTAHILGCVAEEACEVGQAAMKILRFGVGADNKNLERLTAEVNDLYAVLQLLSSQGIVVKHDDELIAKKQKKVIKHFNAE